MTFFAQIANLFRSFTFSWSKGLYFSVNLGFNNVVHFEDFRRLALNHVAELPAVKRSSPFWSAKIREILPDPVTSDSILRLSDNLAEIFTSSSVGRTQSGVSSAGQSWQALVMWYLNLCLVGTNCVVVPPVAKFRPSVIKDATDVRMNGRVSNTETDLLAFTVPASSTLPDAKLATINSRIASTISDTRVTIIQCKTNWNDNAQIPMLWNQIYELARQGNRFAHLSVGNTYQPSQFKDFTYAFVTVPSQGSSGFNPSSTPVLRVSGLSGGNYWGYPSTPSVAESLYSFFNRNFATSFNPGGIKSFIDKNLVENTLAISLQDFIDFNF